MAIVINQEVGNLTILFISSLVYTSSVHFQHICSRSDTLFHHLCNTFFRFLEVSLYFPKVLTKMEGFDVDRQAGPYLISGRPSNSSNFIVKTSLALTMSLLRRHLVCFYCGRRSAKNHVTGTRKWECENCEAVNHLDEVGNFYLLFPPFGFSKT